MATSKSLLNISRSSGLPRLILSLVVLMIMLSVLPNQLLLVNAANASSAAGTNNMMQDISITGGSPTVINGGNAINLRLDRMSASGFQSKQEYQFTRIDMQIKLPAGNSAGTVTTFYMSSAWSDTHDEIDLEFLGNETGKPITLHTNIYAQGKGNKEMQFHLWFDPTAAYHTYSILWNQKYIILYVDGKPLRVFPNQVQQSGSIPYPTSKPMKVYASIWNADDWATQGGRIKTDWTKAPFIASYTNFKATPCPSSSKSPLCWASSAGASVPTTSPPSSSASTSAQSLLQLVGSGTVRTMQLLQKQYMIYNYCSDVKRFPQGLPAECSTQTQLMNMKL